jgi:uncharacterized iron-regulated protein
MRCCRSLLVLLILAPACRPAPPTTAYQLALGPPGQRHRLVTLRPGDLHASGPDQRIGFEALVARLAPVRVVLVGEVHDQLEAHLAQARILDALARRAPGQVALGLEMLDPSADAALADFVAGRSDDRGLARAVRWYETWGFPFRLYRPVLQVARAHRIPIHGLNAPLALVRRVGRQGLAALSPAERATLPPVALDVPRHRSVFAALLGIGLPGRRGHHAGLGHGPGLARLHAAQSLRDEVMAHAVRQHLARPGGPGQMVVLAGNGHVVYGEGVNGRILRRAPALTQTTVVCLGVEPGGERVSRGLGDYLWAFDGTRSQEPPGLGVTLAPGTGPGLRVTGLAPRSAARDAGIATGDVLLEADGVPLAEVFDLRWHLETLTPGARVVLRFRRGAGDQRVTVRLAGARPR